MPRENSPSTVIAPVFTPSTIFMAVILLFEFPTKVEETYMSVTFKIAEFETVTDEELRRFCTFKAAELPLI